MTNPAILGGEGFAKAFYNAMQVAAAARGIEPGPPWDALDDLQRGQWIAAGHITVDFLLDAGLVDRRITQLRRGTGTVLPQQRGN